MGHYCSRMVIGLPIVYQNGKDKFPHVWKGYQVNIYLLKV